MNEFSEERNSKSIVLTGFWGKLELLADRGLWWVDQQTLLIADLHLGKDSSFRRQGLAVPNGSTQKCLERLTAMISKFPVKRLMILGDLFHSKNSLAEQVLEDFDRFLQHHKTIDVTLIKGNHDKHTGDLPDDWNMNILDPPITVDGLMLTHYPQAPNEPASLCIAGHLHPAVRLPQSMALSGRIACFFLSKQACLTLPAFGEFVGTSLVDTDTAKRLWLATPPQVIEVPVQLFQETVK